MNGEIVPGGSILAPCVIKSVRARYEESFLENRRTFLRTSAATVNLPAAEGSELNYSDKVSVSA